MAKCVFVASALQKWPIFFKLAMKLPFWKPCSSLCDPQTFPQTVMWPFMLAVLDHPELDD